MRCDEAAYLLDMLLAAKDVQEFSSGLTFEQFAGNRLYQMNTWLRTPGARGQENCSESCGYTHRKKASGFPTPQTPLT